MTTPIGRFLNAFPDWVIPFCAATLVLIVFNFGGRSFWRRAAKRRKWTCRRVAQIVVAGLLAAVAGAWLATNVVRPIYQAYRADGWRTTTGTVKRSRLFSHPHGSHPTTYSVDFLYGFVLDGQGYEGDRYDASVHFEADHDTKAAFADAYPPGTPVTIRFNPVDGDDSFLSTRLPHDLFEGAWVYGMLLIIATGIAVVTLRESDGATAASLQTRPSRPARDL
ncbi:MAG: hypothetical protein JWM57_320 [Phycisphaerales bacterium]|nr:hypothetical protein [Phycisphaerales bacterium]